MLPVYEQMIRGATDSPPGGGRAPAGLSPGARYILLATLFFALMNIGVKALGRIPAHEVVFFRALTSLVAGYLLLLRGHISPWGNHRPLLLARGMAGTVALVLYFYTLQRLPLSTAVTVQHLSPLFTILISGVLLGEPARARQWAYFLLAFAGVVLIKGFDGRVSAGLLLLGICAAFFAGLAYNLVRMLKDHDHPLVVVFYFPMVTVPLIGGYTLTHWVWPQGTEWALLLGVGLSTTAAQIYLTRAYQVDRAARISIFNYLGIVLAVVVGWVLFAEPPGLLALGGMALIVLGVYLGGRAK